MILNMDDKLKPAAYRPFFNVFVLCLAAVFLVFFTPVYSRSGELEKMTDNLSQAKPLSSMAIMPLENLSNHPEAAALVSRVLREELKKVAPGALIDDNAVDEFITNRRIRYTGAVSRLIAREMGKDLGIDAVMITSIDLFEETTTQVTVGLTARLISTHDGSIIWSNSSSYSGRDFQRFLGLGIIDSSEKLSSVVIKELISSFPGSYFPVSELQNPFEVARVVTSTDSGRSNDKIDLSVQLESFANDPQEVRVIVGGNEAVLSKWKRNIYRGSLNAPVDEGPYHLDVIAIDRSGIPYSFNAISRVTIDNTPPKVSLALNRSVFAPKNKGYVTFTPNLIGFEKINEWAIEIADDSGNLVRSNKGYGSIPKKLIWRGRTDKMAIVSDGKYEYRFKVKDEAGNETVLLGELKVNHRPPAINVDVDISDDALEFTFDKDGDEDIESWQFSMLQRDGNILKSMTGKGDIPKTLEYQLNNATELSTLAFSVDATDSAGNTFALKKSISSYISKSRVPFARLKEMNNSIENF